MINSIKTLTVVAIILAVLGLGHAGQQATDNEFHRNVRAFPYSGTMFKTFRPYENDLQLVYPALPSSPVEREIADLVDSIDSSYGRFRRSDAPVYKRYACRFKFCRIFDA